MPRFNNQLSAKTFRALVNRFILFAACLVCATTAYAVNPIQTENAKAGATDWKLTNPATSREIEGYASLTSVNRGGTISFYVNTAEANYTIDIYRMGWYGGLGARKLLGPINRGGTSQAIPTPDPTTGLVECRWINPYTLTIPSSATDPTDWASGFYLAKLTATTSGKQSYIVFVVRDDARPSDYLFQSSVTTFQAYNNWGGKSLYSWNSTNQVAAQKVSFNRPYALGNSSKSASGVGAGEFLTNLQPSGETFSGAWEYNMARFLEREGYDVTYCTDIDTHENSGLLLSHKAFLVVGHDEYWTWQMRANVENARDHGVGLGFFSANTCYWQIRLEASPANGAPNRTQVGYKDSGFSQDPVLLDSDSSNDYLATVNWRDALVSRPEDALLGVMYEHDPVDVDLVVENAANWVFTNTGLSNGDHLRGLVGYEVDRMFGNAPANTVRLAHSPYQNTTTFYSDMTVYTAPSGANVFATGSIQWSWGLDDYNAFTIRTSRLSQPAQQMTRNVLARLAGASLPPAPAPLPTSLSDDFNDNLRDTSKWLI